MLYGSIDSEVTDYCVWDDGSFAINNFQYDQDQRVMKPEKKPDSWEQLEADAGKRGKEYWGCKGVASCVKCEHGSHQTGKACWQNKEIDIIRRAKALAGVDDE